MRNQSFEDTVGKGENDGNQHSLLPQYLLCVRGRQVSSVYTEIYAPHKNQRAHTGTRLPAGLIAHLPTTVLACPHFLPLPVLCKTLS